MVHLEKKKEDPVLHIEVSFSFLKLSQTKKKLRRWADIFLIAPLSSNTLAKVACGLNDNLLTCVARAWDFKNPFFVAPAMNTMMWSHPFTSKHLNLLSKLGIKIIYPISKKLACGDIGVGAMESVDNIVAVVKKKAIEKPKDDKTIQMFVCFLGFLCLSLWWVQ